MIIEVLYQPRYGKNLFYPVSNDAKTLCELTRTVTLTMAQLATCKKAGWDISIKAASTPLDHIFEQLEEWK